MKYCAISIFAIKSKKNTAVRVQTNIAFQPTLYVIINDVASSDT